MNTIKKTAGSLLGGLSPILWHKICCNCHTPISEDDQFLCRDCWQQLRFCSDADFCPRCGRDAGRYALLPNGCANCQNEKLHFDGIARAGAYRDAMRNIILSFKMRDRTEYARLLSFLAQAAFAGSAFHNSVELFVPVPLHWRTRLSRGYNQSHVIAKAMKKDIPISDDLLRARFTKTQAKLTSFARRAANVADAFAIRRGHNFADKNICLVDDIKTSGATLSECARVLKAAGANKVFAVVLAVAAQNT